MVIWVADILQSLFPKSNVILMPLKLNQIYNLSLHIHIVYQLVHSRNGLILTVLNTIKPDIFLTCIINIIYNFE